jgi:nitrite reductase/ring-hydroxylating ferredoxin subunit
MSEMPETSVPVSDVPGSGVSEASVVPARRARAPRERVAVIPKDELAPGTWTTRTVRRREVVIVNADGEVFAIFNRCPHQQALLSKGRLAGAPASGAPGTLAYEPGRYVLRCPWHHYEFDLRTGRCLADPERLRVATYEVREEGEQFALYA